MNIYITGESNYIFKTTLYKPILVIWLISLRRSSKQAKAMSLAQDLIDVIYVYYEHISDLW